MVPSEDQSKGVQGQGARRSRRDALLAAAMMAACLVYIAALATRQHITAQFDDAYITYRYAHNLVMGRGFVYNPGEAVLGTTAPLYGLLLALFHRLGVDLPAISQVLGTLGWMASALLCGVLPRRDGHVERAASVALMATFPLLLQVLGMETNIVLALVLASFCLFLENHTSSAFLVAGLATWMRPDSGLVVVILFLVLCVRRRSLPWRQALICGLVLAPWLVYAQFTYGSFLPNSLWAKAGQGSKPNLGGRELGSFAWGAWQRARELYALHHGYALIGVLALVGAVGAIWRRRPWLLIVLWGVAYLLTYTLLGVSTSPWYYPPLWPGIALLAAEGMGVLHRWLKGIKLISWLSYPTTALLLLFAIAPQVYAMRAFVLRAPSPYVVGYRRVGEWLRSSTPPGASVAMIEIGIIGYEADRTVVDTMGLVSPFMRGHLYSWEQTLAYALHKGWPDYAVALSGTAWDAIVNTDWFRAWYERVATFPSLGPGSSDASVYRRTVDPQGAFASATSFDVTAAGVLRLQRIGLAPTNLTPQGRLAARITWLAQGRTSGDYRVKYQLMNARTGQRWSLGVEQPMHGGAPTLLWQRGEEIADYLTWPVPSDLANGPYQLEITVLADGGLAVPFAGPGNVAARLVMAGPMWVGPGDEALSFATEPSLARFGESLLLLEGNVVPRRPAPGQLLTVTTAWRALAPVNVDYTIFAHIVDGTGKVVAQKDGPPLAVPSRYDIGLPG